MGSTSGQELTASQETLVTAEAQRHVERYYDLYYERDTQALSTEIFTLPWMSSGGNGIQVRTTEEDNLAYFETAIAGLVEQDWKRSIFTTKNVCVLSAGSAMPAPRTRTDGSIMCQRHEYVGRWRRLRPRKD